MVKLLKAKKAWLKARKISRPIRIAKRAIRARNPNEKKTKLVYSKIIAKHLKELGKELDRAARGVEENNYSPKAFIEGRIKQAQARKKATRKALASISSACAKIGLDAALEFNEQKRRKAHELAREFVFLENNSPRTIEIQAKKTSSELAKVLGKNKAQVFLRKFFEAKNLFEKEMEL